MYRSFVRALPVVCLLLPSSLAHADNAVVFTNGDTLTGTISERTPEQIRITTSFGATLDVPLTAIATIDGVAPDIAAETANLADQVTPAKDVKPRFDHEGQIDASAQVVDGNTQRKNYSLKADASIRQEDNRYSVGASYNYGSSKGVRDIDNMSLSAKYDRFITERWYGFTNANYLKDTFRDIKARYSTGAGFGYQFYDTDALSLSAEAGLNYVREELADEINDYPAARWRIDYKHDIITDRLAFFHEHEGLLNLRDSHDLSVRSTQGLRVPLTTELSAHAKANIDWENRPAGNREAFDSVYLFGIGYQW